MQAPELLLELLRLPTASFREDGVVDALERLTSDLDGVSTRRDADGNLLARYTRGRRRAAPLVFTAHTDHPSFVAQRLRRDGDLVAAFRGGVRPEYFAGSRVRFWTPDGRVRGTVRKVLATHGPRNRKRFARPDEVLIAVDAPVPAEAIGMWDLPDPRERGGRVYARGCDDIAGCAALVELLRRLAAERVATDVLCLFTRAEEVGFVGAIAAAKRKTLPAKSPVIAIETSKTLPQAPLDGGPILRVGDRMTIFTPALTMFCEQVAEQLAAADRTFTYQRKLMDGGTCEASAFLAYGYATTGICIALGNYHNMNERTGKIGSEYVSLADWFGMVRWFVALAEAPLPSGAAVDPKLRAGMDRRLAEHRERLDAAARRR
jgi:putative aminopeptidase FrvX